MKEREIPKGPTRPVTAATFLIVDLLRNVTDAATLERGESVLAGLERVEEPSPQGALGDDAPCSASAQAELLDKLQHTEAERAEWQRIALESRALLNKGPAWNDGWNCAIEKAAGVLREHDGDAYSMERLATEVLALRCAGDPVATMDAWWAKARASGDPVAAHDADRAESREYYCCQDNPDNGAACGICDGCNGRPRPESSAIPPAVFSYLARPEEARVAKASPHFDQPRPSDACPDCNGTRLRQAHWGMTACECTFTREPRPSEAPSFVHEAGCLSRASNPDNPECRTSGCTTRLVSGEASMSSPSDDVPTARLELIASDGGCASQNCVESMARELLRRRSEAARPADGLCVDCLGNRLDRAKARADGLATADAPSEPVRTADGRFVCGVCSGNGEVDGPKGVRGWCPQCAGHGTVFAARNALRRERGSLDDGFKEWEKDANEFLKESIGVPPRIEAQLQVAEVIAQRDAPNASPAPRMCPGCGRRHIASGLCSICSYYQAHPNERPSLPEETPTPCRDLSPEEGRALFHMSDAEYAATRSSSAVPKEET